MLIDAARGCKFVEQSVLLFRKNNSDYFSNNICFVALLAADLALLEAAEISEQLNLAQSSSWLEARAFCSELLARARARAF